MKKIPLKLKGADIIVTPTNNMTAYETYQETYLTSRAMENELPIALCNRIGSERELTFFGESAAYDAYGNKLKKLNHTVSVQTVDIPLHVEKDRNLQL
ncbi:carbon-nitrogen hydrolase family protein [Lentibacillus lipolyticus]|nr:carbon-nitrogen hydrolase family protein [Lentibacillus lipolyticus]